MKEFTKKCDLCKKKREAHMFWKKINGKNVRLCKECWNKQV
jgi:hypothetical protein